MKTENKQVELMPEFRNGGDGAHCGLDDWYEDKEAALEAALASGKPFDTGWYSSKKEIASARISSDGKTVFVEVSVSDDFDTDGRGEATAECNLDSVREAIDSAWNDAGEDQKDNRAYQGYRLTHYSTKIPDHYRQKGDKRKRYGRKKAQTLDYFIAPAGDGFCLDVPPGDNYYYWGWQNDYRDGADGEGSKCVEDGIPAETVEAFEKFAAGGEVGVLRIGDWEIASWEE